MTTYAAALAEARAALERASIENAALDARVLLAAAAQLDMAGLIARGKDILPHLAQARFRNHIVRRSAGEPVAHILGEAEFWGLPIRLNAATLAPRPDTETLVEIVLEEARRRMAPDVRICDLGTGSGAIAIALLKELPEARALATDISGEALAMARRNAERLGVLARLELRKVSFVEGPAGPFDIVVSNPPYVRSGEIETLQREVRDHDPRAALDGGPDGLAAYRTILGRAGELLGEKSFIAFEVGYDQSETVAALCRAAGLSEVRIVKDLAGNGRVVVAGREAAGEASGDAKKTLGKIR